MYTRYKRTTTNLGKSTSIAIQMRTRQMSVKVGNNLHTNLNHFVEARV